ETLTRAPGLNGTGLVGAALYYDAQVEYAERLAVENVLSAAAAGAHVLTYARVERGLVEEGVVRGVEFQDLRGGRLHTARARVVVNVAGPWVDELVARMPANSMRLVGGTKGSHLIVAAFPGAPADALYVEAEADGRPFFIIPWNGLYLVGTTDTRFVGELDRVEADEAEIAYLLRETNRVIPSAGLTRESVLYTYAGVRPLPHRADHAPARITRRHFIRDHAPALAGFVSVVGGKLTTYRELSEQTVDLLFRKLGRHSPPFTTAYEPLPGAPCGDLSDVRQYLSAHSGLAPEVNERLLRVYGARAADVLELCGEHPRLCEVFDDETKAIAAEVVFAFREEWAETLADCLLRRTMVGLNSRAGLNAVERAARVAEEFLGWDRARADAEIETYRQYVRRFHPRALLL
ncbi:MAG: glycerol-3-phosphate dehydrogenase/oxidase, partial [Pyrinomonadaceae bacterium]